MKNEKVCYLNFLIVFKNSSNEAYYHAKEVCQYIRSMIKSSRVYFEQDYVESIKKDTDNSNILPFYLGVELDLCITIGGDGTVLWAHSLFSKFQGNKPPFVTFYLGSLGYLSYYDIHITRKVINEIASGISRTEFEERSTLECKKISTKEGELTTVSIGSALNDLVIIRESLQAISLDIYVNDYYLTSIKSDGVIVSTSTGSTAYSLSTGASIVHFELDCLILTAISPHSLSFRPIVFPKNTLIKIVLNKNSQSKAHFSTDGITKDFLNYEDSIHVTISQKPIRLMLLNKFIVSKEDVWNKKIVNQLGWNNQFKWTPKF